MTSPLLIPDLLGLADRVEALTGPDIEIDRLIHFHVVAPWLAEKCVKWVHAAFEGPGDFIWWTAERLAETGKQGYPDAWEPYTSSIDAAMTLVPKGWWWRAGECSVSSDATVGPDVAHCPKDILIKFDEGFDVVIEPPTSAALALCVAALRARARATP